MRNEKFMVCLYVNNQTVFVKQKQKQFLWNKSKNKTMNQHKQKIPPE